MNSTNSNNQIENPQPNVEELLRESKKQSKTEAKTASQKEPPTPETLPQQPALPNASDTLQSKTAQQAQALVKADQKAAETRLQMGMKEGLKDAQDIEKGYQIGLLAGITKAKVKNTLELSEQLDLLRQHTDNQIGESLSETLKQALEEADNIDPLEKLCSELSEMLAPTQKEKNGLQILGLHILPMLTD